MAVVRCIFFCEAVKPERTKVIACDQAGERKIEGEAREMQRERERRRGVVERGRERWGERKKKKEREREEERKGGGVGGYWAGGWGVLRGKSGCGTSWEHPT